MKLWIALGTAAAVGWGIAALLPYWEERPRWRVDMASHVLRLAGEKLLALQLPWITRYLDHLSPLLKELPLPRRIDLATFLISHFVAGIPFWILLVYASPRWGLWGGPLCISAGMFLPYIWLKRRQAQFHIALLKALPECLELQSLVMEAGLDLTTGLQHYLEKGRDNPLKPLLQGLQTEIRMGKSRQEAYQNLARRSSFLPLRAACRSIAQGLTLGTPLAPLLREQAAALRLRRMQIAEKKAAEAPIRMLLPLFVFIFPTIFITLLGPIAVLFMNGMN